MTAQVTNLLNAFETTLSTTLGSSGTTVTLTAVTDSASNNIIAPCYLVIEPDSATKYAVAPVALVGIETSPISPGKTVAPNSSATDLLLRTSTKLSGICIVATRLPPAEAVPFT